MPMTVGFKNAMLDCALKLVPAIENPIIKYIGLMNGSSEISGGTPAYARKESTWASPSNGVIHPAVDLTFDIPAGATVTAWAGFSALTGGTNYGGGALTAEAFTAQGQYKLIASGTGILASDP